MTQTIPSSPPSPTARRRRPWRSIALATGMAAVALLTSCGGHNHENSAVSAGARTIAVTADGLAFSPDRITASVGEAVAIELTSVDIAHDLNVDAFDGHVYAEAGTTATGGFTASTPGEFDIYCSIPGHREAGMEGTLVVED